MNHKILFATVALALACTGTGTAAAQTATTPDKPARHMQLDTDNDGTIDRAEAAAAPRLAERFDRIDKNKDGRLAADELSHRHRRHHRGHRGHGMMKLDADKDGRLSKAEASAEPKFAERFAKMDFNRDGYVDRADFKARMEQRRSECFDKADLNHDGKLSRVEYSNMHEVCAPKRDWKGRHAGKRQGAEAPAQ